MINNNYAAGDKSPVQQPNYFEPNASGMVLLVVVIFAAVAGVLATGLHFASSSRITQGRQEMRFEKAFFVAEAGIERAKDALRYNPTNLNTVFFGGATNYGGGTFYVSARTNGGTNNLVTIRSTGMVESVQHSLEVVVRVVPFQPALPQNSPGALGIFGTNTTLTVTGNGNIDGNNYNPDGTLATNADMPGVYYTDTSTVINVTGSGVINGTPPRTNSVGALDEADWYTLLNNMIPVATTYAGDNSILGTRAAPRVTILPSGLTQFSSTISGAGILIVPGYANIKITGQFHYEGLIILEGNGVIDAADEYEQLGKAEIYGSMVCVGGGLDIQASGNADIRYSTSALTNLANLVFSQPVPAQLDMISWKENKASSTNW